MFKKEGNIDSHDRNIVYQCIHIYLILAILISIILIHFL